MINQYVFLAMACVAFLIVFVLVFYIRKLRLRLMTDAATGLPNYDGFLHYIVHKRRGDLSVFLLDLDQFRRFNRQSYDCGDEVLKLFALQLLQHCSKKAFCARYRFGDEFLVVCTADQTNDVREMLASLKHRIQYKNEIVGFSFGETTLSSDEHAVDDAIGRAHGLLMVQKQTD